MDTLCPRGLVDLGFPKAVMAAADGYLFLTPGTEGGVRWQREAVKNRLQEFARAAVPDPRVQPCHGWRHRFMTVARDLDMDAGATRAIVGHSADSVNERYGGFTVAALLREVSKMPRYPEGRD